MNLRWIGTMLLALALVTSSAGGARATGDGGSSGWGGTTVDDIYTSLDGSIEFSDFRFYGVDPDDLTIEVGDTDITFSGDASVTGFGWEGFKIRYTVRSLTDAEIIATALQLDSEVSGRKGAVFATKKIRSPREEHSRLLWGSFESWKRGDGDDDWGDDWDDDGPWSGENEARGDFGRRGWRGKGHGSEHIGTLRAYNIAAGWICGCGHHHESVDDVESECSIEQAMDSIEYDGEGVLHIEDTVKLFSFGKGGVTWHSVRNSYVVTPEPGTAGLFGLGLAGLIGSGRRRQRKTAHSPRSAKS